MNADLIDIEFARMIRRRGIAKHLKLSYPHVRVLRNQLKNGKKITLDKKLRLLQLAGWRMDDRIYTHKDLVEAIRFALNASEPARKMGAEYLAEKWLTL